MKYYSDAKSNYTVDGSVEDSKYNKVKETRSLYDNELNIYIENNIDINNIEEISMDKSKRILENHVTTFSRIKVDEIWGSKPKEESVIADQLYEGNSRECFKNRSLFNCLVEEYGLEKILYLNVTNIGQLTYKEVFGRTFDGLSVNCMNYLKEISKVLNRCFSLYFTKLFNSTHFVKLCQ